MFLVVYTVEMTLKCIAKGFVISKFSYLRNGWNILDCIVVISSYATIVLTALYGDDDNNDGQAAVDVDFLRTLRVLRAIKTISILPGKTFLPFGLQRH